MGHQGGARHRGGYGMPGHLIFQAGQPSGIGAAFRQQAVAVGHGGLVRGDFAGMGGVQREDQPVQKAAPAGRAFLEQPVHLRG